MIEYYYLQTKIVNCFLLQYKFVTPLTSMVVTKPDESDLGTLEDNEDAQRMLICMNSLYLKLLLFEFVFDQKKCIYI